MKRAYYFKRRIVTYFEQIFNALSNISFLSDWPFTLVNHIQAVIYKNTSKNQVIPFVRISPLVPIKRKSLKSFKSTKGDLHSNIW